MIKTNNFKKLFCVLGFAAMTFAAHAIKVGDAAPDFTLKDGANKEHKLSTHKGKYVVLEWLNHGCPFVKKHYGAGNMQALQKEFTAKGVVWYSINSGAEGQQGYMNASDTLKAQKEHKSVATAVLIDSKGTVGKSYDAKVTPHMFIISPEGKVIYNGAIDDKATPDQADIAKSKPLFKNALTAAMEGKKVELASNKPYGCGVKYQ